MYQVSKYDAGTGDYIGCVKTGMYASEATLLARRLTNNDPRGTVVYIAERERK